MVENDLLSALKLKVTGRDIGPTFSGKFNPGASSGVLPYSPNKFKSMSAAKKYQASMRKKYNYTPAIYLIDGEYVVVKPKLDNFNADNDRMTREAGALLR